MWHIYWDLAHHRPVCNLVQILRLSRCPNDITISSRAQSILGTGFRRNSGMTCRSCIIHENTVRTSQTRELEACSDSLKSNHLSYRYRRIAWYDMIKQRRHLRCLPRLPSCQKLNDYTNTLLVGEIFSSSLWKLLELLTPNPQVPYKIMSLLS